MKTNNLFLQLLVLMTLSVVSCQLSSIYAQDTLYTYKGGVVTSKRAVLEIDSMTFTAPSAPSSTCGAYIAQDVWKEFMCHNLGANQSLDAFTYSEGINGDYYQWGRPTDGHEKKTSGTTSTLATTNTPGHANFITTSAVPRDWRSGGEEITRWTDATKAANDPCPAGFKVPSQAQWAGVRVNNTKVWATGYKFGDKLFLPASGSRSFVNGSMV